MQAGLRSFDRIMPEEINRVLTDSTLHRPSNVDTEDTLRPLLGAVARIQAESPVIFPVHPRTRGRLARLTGAMPTMANLRLVDPLPYLDFVQLMANARCVLRDPGGIQEETAARASFFSGWRR